MKCQHCDKEISMKSEVCPYCKNEITTIKISKDNFLDRGRIKENWEKNQNEKIFINAILTAVTVVLLLNIMNLDFVHTNMFYIVPLIIIYYPLLYIGIPHFFSECIIRFIVYYYMAKHKRENFYWFDKKIELLSFLVLIVFFIMIPHVEVLFLLIATFTVKYITRMRNK